MELDYLENAEHVTTVYTFISTDNGVTYKPYMSVKPKGGSIFGLTSGELVWMKFMSANNKDMKSELSAPSMVRPV